MRHFLSLMDLSVDELMALLRRAAQLKTEQQQGRTQASLPGRVLAMIFEKSSTRTRVSFEVGIKQLGGHAIFLSAQDSQLGRGESLADTARVLSGLVDLIVVRTFGHDKVVTLAKHAEVPVINGLSDTQHPCQLLADLQTWFEYHDRIQGAVVAWIGDGNNMCHSWIEAARLLDFKLNIACPVGYEPDADRVRAAKGQVELISDPLQAVCSANLLVTDVWASMGQESEQASRADQFSDYQVNTRLMQAAADGALFMHCLPAHRGEEVSAKVMDGPQSVVWVQAQNRLHSQKALMEFLLLDSQSI